MVSHIRRWRILVTVGALTLAACGNADDGDSRAARSSASPAALSGERLFSQCAVCHTAAAPGTAGAKLKLVGPPLWGVVGRNSAALPEFKYSRAMQNASLVWDEATLDAFLENPHKVVPGTIMSYAGERDPTKRTALIEHLKTLK